MENKKTLWEVISNLDIKKMVEVSATYSLFLFASFAILSPSSAFWFFFGVISASNFFVAKTCTLWLVFFRRKEILKFVKKCRLNLSPFGNNESALYNIPIAELLNFLYDKKGFPAKEFMERFGANSKTHAKISRILCEGGVLYKGQYNRLCLDETLARTKINDILEGRPLRISVNGESDPQTQEEVMQKLTWKINKIC